MGWKTMHRWLGLTAGTLALVLGLTGALLAFDPVQQAWVAPAAARDLPVATLVERVSRSVPGTEEIRRLPSGAIVAFGFDGDQMRAVYVDAADGAVLGPYQPSALPRWVTNLHRSLLLGDAGRWGAAGVALAMLVMSISGLVLLVRRMGGWRQLPARVRGSLAQRVHVVAGRMVLALLLLSSMSALYMSATTLELIALGSAQEPEVASVADGRPPLSVAQLPLLQDLSVGGLRRVNFPDASDPADSWKVGTVDGEGWIDRYSGRTLAWQDATAAQRAYDWARLLHSGDGAWPLAVLLGIMGASIPLFWLSGLLIWWQARRDRPRIANNSALADADTRIFVASEGGSTWGFAQALHDALARNGHRVHTAPLEHFDVGPETRRIFVLASTHGDGQPPAHAARALERIAQRSTADVPVAVLGFGDRQFPSYCGFAEALERMLRERGWPELLPLERIHQQSAQQFGLWGEALGQALGEPIALDYRPRLPRTTALELAFREDYPGSDEYPTAILRFRWQGRGPGHFDAGDLVGILPPGSPVPRYYSLASGSKDGFLEICVRHWSGGLCSTHLLGLATGDSIQAFIRPNPGFALGGDRRPVLLIGAGTGVAPLAGFIRRNDRRVPMHLYFGTRDPAKDYYFGPDIARWRDEGRVASVQTAFSRVPDGGGHVQDALRRDAERVRDLVSRGATVRVCGSRPMARGVAEALDAILAALHLDVRQLKAKGRYAEDVF
ncbi:MAG: PepSY domain-containing protein [Burkholderiales bacterium]